MGVPGLTRYISENEDVFLKPFELSETYLVIDGSGVASQLYLNIIGTKNTSIFGGDYDEYYFATKQFFLSLAKCNVTPIVLLDGSYEKKKLRTVLERSRERVRAIKNFNEGDLGVKFFPMLLFRTFVEVLKDMNIICQQCYYEADDEIATMAKALNCPVLGLDSDFYIFDVKYIPFNTLRKDPVRSRLSYSKRPKFYLECSVFEVNHFLKVNNLEKELLPIFVTMLGNDYIDGCMFHLLFDHMIIPKSKKSYTQRKIYGVIHWLQKENFESAIKGILLHVKNQDSPKILTAIYATAKHYAMGMVSSHVLTLISTLHKGNPSEISWLNVKETNFIWPQEVDQLFRNSVICSGVLNFLTLNSYFFHIQVEDFSKNPTSLPSLRLIGALYEIMHQYNSTKSHSYKVYTMNKNSYSCIIQNWHQEFKNLNFCHHMNLSKKDGLKILFTILNLDDNDISLVSMFPESWILFMATCLYWFKTSHDSLTFTHVAALILMVISNQIVQKKVGYYRTNAAFRNRYRDLLTASFQPNPDPKPVLLPDDFTELIASITMHECVLIQALLMPLRQLQNIQYLLSTVHDFNAFQACLFYCCQINILLNYPTHGVRIIDFYCGTLLFNLYSSIKTRADFPQKILSASPGLFKIYTFLCQALGKYIGLTERETAVTTKKRRRRKKKCNKNLQMMEYSSESDPTPSSDDEFQDNDNSFSLLRKIQALNIA